MERVIAVEVIIMVKAEGVEAVKDDSIPNLADGSKYMMNFRQIIPKHLKSLSVRKLLLSHLAIWEMAGHQTAMSSTAVQVK